MRELIGLATLACLMRGDAMAQGILFRPGNFVNSSQVVPSSCTTVITAPPGTNATRMRIVAIDTAIQSGSSTTVTTWCAWGTAQANCAVPGSNGFPLNAGIDDNGPGVNQNPLNCSQPSGSHYIRLEQY